METLQELNEALASAGVGEDVIGAIPGLIDARVKEGVTSETETLTLNRDKALGEVKRLKTKLESFVDSDGNPIMVEDIPDLLALAEKGRRGADDQEDYEVLKARHEEPWKKKVADLEADRNEALGELQRVLLDEQMMDALAEGGIDSKRIRIALNHLKSERDFKVEKVNGKWQAFEEVEGKSVPLAASMKSFLDSDEAKFFRAASGSSGGGAEGGDPPASGDSKEKRFKAVIASGNATEMGKLYREDPALYEKVKKAHDQQKRSA